MTPPRSADRSWRGQARRRLARFVARRPARAPDRPMISFAFDDAPATAALEGAFILQERGLRGSYYIAADIASQESPCGRIASAAAIRRLARAGHEVGCHTFSHLDCALASAAEIEADVARNQQALAAWGLPAPTTFAYPLGEVTVRAKRRLAPKFALLRALHHGLIVEGADLNQAPAVGIEGPKGEAAARRWLAQAAGRPSWLILYTHDVCETPSPFGCTPKALAGLADDALAAGFEVVTVAAGARRLGG